MTRIKLCGLKSERDIMTANELSPDYIGFVFAEKSRRYVTPDRARELRRLLDGRISAVGVFVNEKPETVSELLESGVIDLAQLHGDEDEDYIARLRELTDKPVIKAFRIGGIDDIMDAENSTADLVLLDNGGGGTGETFDWEYAKAVKRPYILAGGLGLHNIKDAVETLRPFGVDVSSGIETEGVKDPGKMKKFVGIIRDACRKE
jgi:phosphoribosylanthranilate isomerase